MSSRSSKRAARSRAAERTHRQTIVSGTTTCVCGKRSYLTRKDAKDAARRVGGDPRRGHPNAYECAQVPGAWHGGLLPPEVARGTAERPNVTQPRNRPEHVPTEILDWWRPV